MYFCNLKPIAVLHVQNYPSLGEFAPVRFCIISICNTPSLPSIPGLPTTHCAANLVDGGKPRA